MSLYVSVGVSDGEEAHAWEHRHRHLRSEQSQTAAQRLRSSLESVVKLGLTYYCLHMATSRFFPNCSSISRHDKGCRCILSTLIQLVLVNVWVGNLFVAYRRQCEEEETTQVNRVKIYFIFFDFINTYQYVSLDHKTSQKGYFFKIGIYT